MVITVNGFILLRIVYFLNSSIMIPCISVLCNVLTKPLMDFRTRLKGAGLGLLICILALPVAFFITVITFPFWRWFESITEIESFGHSGPAEWCYWLVYGVLILIATFIWWLAQRQSS